MAEPIIVNKRAGNDNRRVVRIAVAGVALLLALVVLPKVLGGGGGDDTSTDAFPPQVTGTSLLPSGPPPEETFESFSAKNPFTPLVELGGEGDSGGDLGTPPDLTPPPTFDDGSGGFPIDDGSGGPIDDGSGGAAPPDGGTTTTTAPPRVPDRVSLLEVYRDQDDRVLASIRVNDITYQVGTGETFARSYRVVSLDSATRCGDFLFGDDRFRLCEGDEVRK